MGVVYSPMEWTMIVRSRDRFSCSYEPLLGAILSSIDGKSTSRPGSYSIVVRAAVDPGTKRNATPFLIVPFSTMVCTLFVMSSISPSFWVASLTIWDSTVMFNSFVRQGIKSEGPARDPGIVQGERGQRALRQEDP